MSFYEVIERYHGFDFESAFERFTAMEVERALNKNNLNEEDLLALLSPAAVPYLEKMAQKVHQSALGHFGRAVLLYTPLYIANHCNNHCTYCSFNMKNEIERVQLSYEEIEKEAKAIYEQGFRHIVVLTGEDKQKTPVSYIEGAVKILKKYFDSIALEVYSMEEEEYRIMYAAGADSFTMYQETYDEACYKIVHPKGPKHHYKYRLDTPERAAAAGMRSVNISALLGLSPWRSEAFFTALHGAYIQRNYKDVDIIFSVPRIRPYIGAQQAIYEVSDRDLVQAILAYRLFMPHASISVSTRENAELRRNLLPFGVTKLSAGSKTMVGGHSEDHDATQFEIADSRGVEEIREDLMRAGYQPIYKDWMRWE